MKQIYFVDHLHHPSWLQAGKLEVEEIMRPSTQTARELLLIDGGKYTPISYRERLGWAIWDAFDALCGCRWGNWKRKIL